MPPVDILSLLQITKQSLALRVVDELEPSRHFTFDQLQARPVPSRPPVGFIVAKEKQGCVPCRAVPCRAVPCRAVPCRAVPCRATHAATCRICLPLMSSTPTLRSSPPTLSLAVYLHPRQ